MRAAPGPQFSRWTIAKRRTATAAVVAPATAIKYRDDATPAAAIASATATNAGPVAQTESVIHQMHA